MKFDLANAKEVLKWRIAKGSSSNSGSGSGSTNTITLYEIQALLPDSETMYLYSVLEPKLDDQGQVYFDTEPYGGDILVNPSNHPYKNDNTAGYDSLILTKYSNNSVWNVGNQAPTASIPKNLDYLYCNDNTIYKPSDGSGTDYWRYLVYKFNDNVIYFNYNSNTNITPVIYYTITGISPAKTSSSTIYFDTDTASQWELGTEGYPATRCINKEEIKEFYYPINYLMGYRGFGKVAENYNASYNGYSGTDYGTILDWVTYNGDTTVISQDNIKINTSATVNKNAYPEAEWPLFTDTRYGFYSSPSTVACINTKFTPISSSTSTTKVIGKNLYKLNCTVGNYSFSLYSLIEPKTDDNGYVYFADDSDDSKWSSANEIFNPGSNHPYLNTTNTNLPNDGIILTSFADNGKFILAGQSGSMEIDLRNLRYNFSDSSDGQASYKLGSNMFRHPYLRYINPVADYSTTEPTYTYTTCYFTYDQNAGASEFYYTYTCGGDSATSIYFVENNPDKWENTTGYGYTIDSNTTGFYYPVNCVMGAYGYPGIENLTSELGDCSSYEKDNRCWIAYELQSNNRYLLVSNVGSAETTNSHFSWNFTPIITKYAEESSGSGSGSGSSLIDNQVYLNANYELFCNVKASANVSKASDTVSGTVKGYTSSDSNSGIYLQDNLLTLSKAKNNSGESFGGVSLSSGFTKTTNSTPVWYIYSSYDSTYTNNPADGRNKAIWYVFVDAPYDEIIENYTNDNQEACGSVLAWKTQPNILAILSADFEQIKSDSNYDISIKNYPYGSKFYTTTDTSGNTVYTLCATQFDLTDNRPEGFIRSDNIQKQLLSWNSNTALQYPNIVFLKTHTYDRDSNNSITNRYARPIGFAIGQTFNTGDIDSYGYRHKFLSNLGGSIQPQWNPNQSSNSDLSKLTFTGDYTHVTSLYDYNAESILALSDSEKKEYPGYTEFLNQDSEIEYPSKSYSTGTEVITLGTSTTTTIYYQDGKQYCQAMNPSDDLYVDLNNYYTKDEIGDLTKDLASLFELKLNS